jgi:hypothetical protein
MGHPLNSLLPETCCRIIHNIVDNAFALREELELIIASTGREKCENGRFIAHILKKEGFKVIEAPRHKSCLPQRELRFSIARMPLREKITRIMDMVREPRIDIKVPLCKPEFGFWGVPPNDFSLLDLFPETTHVYGWTRCVEAGKPEDLELECYVDPKVKTVFFVQTFCAKQLLARHLAEQHGGLFIDIDKKVTGSTLAKVEAFLRLC